MHAVVALHMLPSLLPCSYFGCNTPTDFAYVHMRYSAWLHSAKGSICLSFSSTQALHWCSSALRACNICCWASVLSCFVFCEFNMVLFGALTFYWACQNFLHARFTVMLYPGLQVLSQTSTHEAVGTVPYRDVLSDKSGLQVLIVAVSVVSVHSVRSTHCDTDARCRCCAGHAIVLTCCDAPFS